jgi:hypothetical protein
MVLRHIQLYFNRPYYQLQFSFSKRTSPAAADENGPCSTPSPRPAPALRLQHLISIHMHVSSRFEFLKFDLFVGSFYSMVPQFDVAGNLVMIDRKTDIHLGLCSYGLH